MTCNKVRKFEPSHKPGCTPEHESSVKEAKMHLVIHCQVLLFIRLTVHSQPTHQLDILPGGGLLPLYLCTLSTLLYVFPLLTLQGIIALIFFIVCQKLLIFVHWDSCRPL